MKYVNYCNLLLKSPIVMSSGIWSNNIEIVENAIRNGFGAITSKSITLHERPEKGGYFSFDSYKLNNLGVPNLPFGEQMEYVTKIGKLCRVNDVAYIASVWATGIVQLSNLFEMLHQYKGYFDAIEINMSCPNDDSGIDIATGDSSDIAFIVNDAKQIFGNDIPIICKLPPDMFGIDRIARSVRISNADGVTCVNTMPSMFVDLEDFSVVSGGMSGKALLPIALKFVYEYRKLNHNAQIIGCGGVKNEQDIVRMLIAGANVVGIGSAFLDNGDYPYAKLLNDYIASKKETYMSIVSRHGDIK